MEFFTEDEINNFELKLEVNNIVHSSVDIFISFNKFPILLFHKKYRSEQPPYDKHWAEYWNDRNIYDTKSVKYLNVKKYDQKHKKLKCFINICNVQWNF